jgi:hypothetical protein
LRALAGLTALSLDEVSVVAMLWMRRPRTTFTAAGHPGWVGATSSPPSMMPCSVRWRTCCAPCSLAAKLWQRTTSERCRTPPYQHSCEGTSPSAAQRGAFRHRPPTLGSSSLLSPPYTART